MSHYFFNRYTALSIGGQFIVVPLIWIADVVISPRGDSIFLLIFYFYLPTIFLVSSTLKLMGESGMIADVIFGMMFGIFVYGLIFGFLMAFLKRLILRGQARGDS